MKGITYQFTSIILTLSNGIGGAQQNKVCMVKVRKYRWHAPTNGCANLQMWQYPVLIPEAVWRLTCLYTIAGSPAPSPYERQEGALVYS